MTNSNTKSLFLRFLKENDIYHLFITNFNNFHLLQNYSLQEYLEIKNPNFFISDAFVWSRTNENYIFWKTFSSKWRSFKLMHENKQIK